AGPQRRPADAPVPDAVLERFREVVGPEHAISDPGLQMPYLHEWRDLYLGRTPLVLRPGTTQEVAHILGIASEARIGIVPQGGNTGLVGGQIPSPDGSEVLLSLSRLTRVRELDDAGTAMVVE